MNSDDLLKPDVEDEELAAELLECNSCEARYCILLGEDYLNEYSHYCPFCGEYNVGDN